MAMDIRLKQLSYSSTVTLHKCPRKYQLYKLQGKESDSEEDVKEGITFAFGHAIGFGIQCILEGQPLDSVIFQTFINWYVDPFAEIEKKKKSLFYAIHAIQQFASMVAQNRYLEEYELVYYQDKPANELGFLIRFPDNFVYRGFVDTVLRHKTTGEILVLELKTTGNKTAAATYRNSAQAIGYSIVLDVLFPGLSSYKVLYLVYESHTREFVQLPFTKSLTQRAQWIRELLLDIEQIKSYESEELYPMHGESCYDFFRECEYLGLCTLSTSNLQTPLTDAKEQEILNEQSKFTIQVTIQDLIASQITRGTQDSPIESELLEHSEPSGIEGDQIL